MKRHIFIIFFIANFAYGQNSSLPVYKDVPFVQEVSTKYIIDDIILKDLVSDRNGNIAILANSKLYQPTNGQFLYPGTIVPQNRYRTSKNFEIRAIQSYQNQLILLSPTHIFSEAWAGKILLKHNLPDATFLVGGQDFGFLISNTRKIQWIKNEKPVWESNNIEGLILDIKYHQNHFWILTDSFLYSLEENKKILKKELGGFKFTAFDLNQNEAVIGTNNGFLRFNLKNKNIEGKLNRKIPVLNITAVKIIGNKIWFGSANGAFALNSNQTIDYYQGKRWLCGNSIVKIEKGPQNSVLILSENGLSQIQFDDWTLAKKAEFYQNQVRQRHIRHGFNATLAGMKDGNLAMGYLDDADNDGLWTAMYLGAEVFKYAVTKDSLTLENIAEALEAMERLYTINPIPGFPARSFERAGYISQLHDPERWQHAPDPAWDWKATTSSDEAIGHIFAYGVLAELVEDPKLKSKAITLIDTLMNHIVTNDFYLIDYDGKPTLWGKWHPDYVNGFEKNIGDRKLNSSNIIAMLQTAYYFTKKPIYKEKALYLLQEKGYFENLMRPFSEIGEAPTDADDKSKLLSDAWNHSDDEMYFLGYWGLYKYALNDTLKNHFKAAIIDHWQIERPEKEGLWNIFTAITGTPNFDLEEAVWYLKEHPLDMIDWNIANSHRKDLNFIKPNFRNQRLDKVLPPDERPIQRHNANMFDLDRNRGEGNSEHSAGDIWLLPYWMGRYLGVISN